jgi:hypothetical protein
MMVSQVCGGALLAFGTSGHQVVPVNSTSMNQDRLCAVAGNRISSSIIVLAVTGCVVVPKIKKPQPLAPQPPAGAFFMEMG